MSNYFKILSSGSVQSLNRGLSPFQDFPSTKLPPSQTPTFPTSHLPTLCIPKLLPSKTPTFQNSHLPKFPPSKLLPSKAHIFPSSRFPKLSPSPSFPPHQAFPLTKLTPSQASHLASPHSLQIFIINKRQQGIRHYLSVRFMRIH